MFKTIEDSQRAIAKNIKDCRRWIKTQKPYTGNNLFRIQEKLRFMVSTQEKLDSGSHVFGHYDFG